ncbi:hypothetical protein RHGRI_018581 [Rhododendron griersonianum]|uniref:Uncharacterized protein n=1 Tax=Rhododendron griersonianum TaxID=479676 RepID=A0AAV6K224_9ERIC|nr:hypothetical protein RHGRI_018581 [Rhododendron griersonianum]
MDANKNKHLGDGGKPTGNDNPLVSEKSECLSPSNADSRKAELVVKAMEEEMKEREVAKGVTETVGDDGSDSRHG